MIATTIEQSQRLLRCGVSADTADMAIDADTSKLYLHPYLARVDKQHELPAWSLSALLGLLPKEIDIDGYKYRISIYFESPDEPVIGNQWCLFYKPKKHNEKSHYIDNVPMYAPNLIECAVLMVEWFTRHNIKLNEI
jgi:hypothetical protein